MPLLKNLLSEGGNASAKAAKSIYIFLAKEWIASECQLNSNNI